MPDKQLQFVCLDQNALINLEDGRTATVTYPVERADKLGVRFVLSLYHVVELARVEDPSRRRKLIAYIDRLHPLWLRERLQLVRNEVADFFYRWLNVPSSIPEPVTSLVDVIGDFGRTPADVDLSQLVEAQRTEMALIRDSHRVNQEARQQVVGKRGQRPHDEEETQQIIARYISPWVPGHTPGGIVIDDVTRKLFREEARRGASKTLDAELAWVEDSRAEGQSVSWNNFIDQHHFVSALPHVDAIATSDKSATGRAERLSKRLGFPIARVRTLTRLFD